MTKVDILNLALGYLGEAHVQSLTQNTSSAKYGAPALKASIDQVLSLHPWNSALKRENLPRLVEENDFGYRYLYPLPVDYLRMVRFNDGVDDYAIEGRNIATDEEVVEIIYVCSPEDVSVLSPTLVEAIAAKLAFNICLNITANSGDQSSMLSLFERHLARARSVDAQESGRQAESLYADTLRDSKMLQARNRSLSARGTRRRGIR